MTHFNPLHDFGRFPTMPPHRNELPPFKQGNPMKHLLVSPAVSSWPVFAAQFHPSSAENIFSLLLGQDVPQAF